MNHDTITAFALARLPHGGCIVCPPEREAAYRQLAKRLGRDDIKVMAPNKIQGVEFTSVIVDEMVVA